MLIQNHDSEYNETSVITDYLSEFSLHIYSNNSLLIVEEEVGN